jgi:hypothetical protein
LHKQLLPRIYQKFEMRIFNRGPLYFSITGLQFHFSSATEIECSLYLKLWIMTSIFISYCEQDAIPNPFGDIISCVKSQTDEGLLKEESTSSINGENWHFDSKACGQLTSSFGKPKVIRSSSMGKNGSRSIFDFI